MRDEKEERKKQERSKQGQTNKQGKATQHTCTCMWTCLKHVLYMYIKMVEDCVHTCVPGLHTASAWRGFGGHGGRVGQGGGTRRVGREGTIWRLLAGHWSILEGSRFWYRWLHGHEVNTCSNTYTHKTLFA